MACSTTPNFVAAGVAGGALGAAAVVGGAALNGAGTSHCSRGLAAAAGVVCWPWCRNACEQWVLDETREKIDDGLEAVGDAITFWD